MTDLQQVVGTLSCFGGGQLCKGENACRLEGSCRQQMECRGNRFRECGKGLDATVEAGKEYEMTVVIDEKGLDNAIGLESVIIRHEENEDRIHEVIPFL